MADFLNNLSLIFVGVIITPLFSNIDTIHISNVLLALVLAILALVGGLLLTKGERR